MLVFRNFGVGSNGEFVSYSYIYFSFFDCELKQLFHVIKCHSYMHDLCPPPPSPSLHQAVHLSTLLVSVFKKRKSEGGGRGEGGQKVIHKLTLSINRPKNLSNKFKLSDKKLNFNFVG